MTSETTTIQIEGYADPVRVHVHTGDLAASVTFQGAVAVDTETMGLVHGRDRLCVVQLSDGRGEGHLVRLPRGHQDSPRLAAILSDRAVTKLYHFARFDLASLQRHYGLIAGPVYCTRTDLLGVEISKQQQSSDWGADTLTQEQIRYAVSDVLYLHRLKERLDIMLVREGRMALAEACFNFLPARAELDLAGWPEQDIFAH